MRSERALIKDLAKRFAREDATVKVGIGDDAAVLRTLVSPVLSVDTSVERTHFRFDLCPHRAVARRAFVAAASDLAAMGAHPRAALVSLVLRPDLSDTEVDLLLDGLDDASRETGTTIVGGNLARGDAVSITTTVVGDVDGPPLLRVGSQVGDGIYVTKTVGDAALGLSLLLAGRGDEPDAQPFVSRWRMPTAELLAGQALRGHVTAALDVSDGLLRDLAHLCGGLGAEVYAAELPRSARFELMARSLDLDPLTLQLAGGEDYGLLFTGPASARAKQIGTRIGRIRVEPGIEVLDEQGHAIDVAGDGYDHFDLKA